MADVATLHDAFLDELRDMWARAMGHDAAADLLEATLEEEKTADAQLTAAEDGINQAAALVAHPVNENEEFVREANPDRMEPAEEGAPVEELFRTRR